MLTKLTKIKRLLLIGKEIWHNKRSMRGRFIIYLLSLVLLAGSAMLILLNVIGIVQPPSHDIDRFLEYELNTRTNDIKRQMNALAAHNIDLSQQLQQDINRVMLEQGIYNNYDALNNNPEALTAIQQATYQTLAAKMQQAPASGALYLINASVNTNLLEPTYNGLFLKFTNIYSENTCSTKFVCSAATHRLPAIITSAFTAPGSWNSTSTPIRRLISFCMPRKITFPNNIS
ncbi:hypothetical protein [Phascolarctobacterium succinatutens]|uniref:hypothetical protein n=1 Tax=Phascolarctobacterium succinatutens TaxID=626940 RepID=UPI003AF9D1C8